jgi:hypothetical protein
MKVGDYIRTENGINKVADYRYEPEYENGHVVWFEKSDSGCRFTDKNLPKSSPNIIDLIEVGDYVNGEKVYYLKGQIDEKEVAHEEDILYTEYNDEYGDWYGYAEDEIETIVTHEQFSQMEYKVGE